MVCVIDAMGGISFKMGRAIMNSRNRIDPLKIYGYLLISVIGVFILMSIAVMIHPPIFGIDKFLARNSLTREIKGQPGGGESRAGKEIQPAGSSLVRRPGPGKESQGDYTRLFTAGVNSYQKGQYHEAVYLLHKAADYRKDDPFINYYLMLCYSRIEKNPHLKNSITSNFAGRVIALSPGSDIAGYAQKLIKKYRGERKIAKSSREKKGIWTSYPRKEKMSTKKVSPAKEKRRGVPGEKKIPLPVPTFPLIHTYPRAKPVIRPAKLTVRRIKVETEVKKTQTDIEEKPSIVTIEGNVSRKDETGAIFNPSGARMLLISMTGSEKYETTTDSGGNYLFSGVKTKDNYMLVCISAYQYKRYIEEYYQYPVRTYYNYSPYYNYGYNRRQKGAGRRHKSKKTGVPIGSFKVGSTRVNVKLSLPTTYRRSTYYGTSYYGPSGGIIYNSTYSYGLLPAQGYYMGYRGSTVREVYIDYNVSWHLRMNLPEPGTYLVNLTPGNADKKYVPNYYPTYSPVSYEPYEEVTDITPAKIKNR